MADVQRVYLDSCCFIDMVKTKVGRKLTTDREMDVWTLKRLLEANRDSEVQCFTSTLSIAECSHDGEGKVTDEVKSEFNRLLMSGQYIRLVQMTPFIAQDARDLRWNHGFNIKGADGIYVASALAMKCDELISCNGKLERLIKSKAAFAKLGLAIKSRQGYCVPSQQNTGNWNSKMVKTVRTAKRNKQDPRDRFEAVAKRLECDEDKAQFMATLGKIARAKPVSSTSKRKGHV